MVVQSAEQIEEVRRAQAEFLFRHKQMTEAAVSYAATTVPFEEARFVCLLSQILIACQQFEGCMAVWIGRAEVCECW